MIVKSGRPSAVFYPNELKEKAAKPIAKSSSNAWQSRASTLPMSLKAALEKASRPKPNGSKAVFKALPIRIQAFPALRASPKPDDGRAKRSARYRARPPERSVEWRSMVHAARRRPMTAIRTPSAPKAGSPPTTSRKLQQAHGRQGRQPRGRARRIRRSARPQRRRQDDRVLHDHRPRARRRRAHHHRRRRRHAPAHVPARPPRHRLPAAGSLDLPRPDRRAEHHGGAGARRAGPQSSARNSSTACSRNFRSRGCASRRRSRCRAASGGAAKSPGRWPPGPRSCCWTNRSPASTPSPSATFSSWCAT